MTLFVVFSRVASCPGSLAAVPLEWRHLSAVLGCEVLGFGVRVCFPRHEVRGVSTK